MWVVVLRQIPFVRDIVYNRPGLDGARNPQQEVTSPGLDGSARAGNQRPRAPAPRSRAKRVRASVRGRKRRLLREKPACESTPTMSDAG